MGQHYVPRFYLRGFAAPDGMVYRYAKKSGEVSKLAIARVEQGKSFYPPEMETYLADKIEAPANKVLKKLREGNNISIQEKLLLSVYIIQLSKRVPKEKKSTMEKTPELVDSVVKEMEEEIDNTVTRYPMLAGWGKEMHAELLQFSEKFREGPGIWLKFLLAQGSPKAIEALSLMKWVFVSDKEDNLITSDNPVFVQNLGQSEGELSFPLSSRLALIASWTSPADLVFHSNTQLCKEVNRRTIVNADQYVYHHSNSQWLRKLLSKSQLRICPIRLI